MDPDVSLFMGSNDYKSGESSGKNGSKRSRGAASSSSASQATSSSPGSSRKKRKKEKVQDLEERVKELEDKNAELRLQLKVGIETQKRDEQEKKEMTKELADLIESNASESAFSLLLMNYVKRFSDYGEDRTRIIQKHMKQLKNLLVPTQVTKMCIWTLHQDDDFYQPEQDADGTSQEKLWTILTKHIEATEEQKEGIKMHREHAIKMAKDLRFTIRACEELESRMERKNRALAEEMKELRKILSPVQMAKFIVWVNEHKASMAMLDKLWSPKDELRRNTGSKTPEKRS